MKPIKIYIVPFLLLVLLIFVALLLGDVSISISEILATFNEDTKYTFIVQEIRIPRILTSIFAGAGLGISGLLMQSYFRNALAGPYILGVSAGAGLGIAILFMAGISLGVGVDMLISQSVGFAILGSISVLGLVLLFSKWVGNGSMLLILGLMIGSIASAIVSILQFFSESEAIKKYLIWTMGSITAVEPTELFVFIPLITLGVIGAWFFVNPLNALLLGDQEAQLLGVPVKQVKRWIIIFTGLIAGVVTAYCGPIAFIGLAAPHIAKILCKTANHQLLIPVTILIGANVLLLSDIISQVPGYDFNLPINAVTSLIGAPLVIYIIIRDRGMYAG